VRSESGVTALSLRWSDNTNGAATAADGNGNDVTNKHQQQPSLKDIGEEILKPMLPSPADLIEFIAHKQNKASHHATSTTTTTEYETEYNRNCQQRGKINIHHVHAAFNAAAYSIVRGNQRAAMEMEVDDDVKIGAGVDDKNNNNNNDSQSTTTTAKTQQYEPPLLQAFESIRSSRMQSLSEASGKSVPSFLKKNNTIPWFHTPVVVDTTSDTKKISSSSSSSPVPMESKSSLSKDSSTTVAATAGKKKAKVQSSSSSAVSPADAAATAAALAIQKKRAREQQPDNVTSTTSSSSDKTGTTLSTDVKTPVKKRAKASTTSQQQQPSSSTATVAGDAKSKSAKSPSLDTKKESGTKSSTPSRTTVTPKRSPSSASKKSRTGSPSKGGGGTNTSSSSSSSANSTKQFSINTTRAILCATASLVFDETTPNYNEQTDINNPSSSGSMGASSIDPRNIPQNTTVGTTTAGTNPSAPKATKKSDFNMDTILNQANSYAKRAVEQANGAAHSSDRKREFLMDSSLARVGMGYDAISGRYHAVTNGTLGNLSMPLVVSNPFAHDDDDDADMTDGEVGYSEDDSQSVSGAKLPQYDMSNDKEWTSTSKPHLMAILNKGAGNAILHDREWTCRAFRVANLLQNLAVPQPDAIPSTPSDKGFVHWNDVRLSGKSSPSLVRGFPNYGPHLIITSAGEDFDTFVSVFNKLGTDGVRTEGQGEKNRRDVFKTNPEEVQLRALPYHGDSSCRGRLRKHFTNCFGDLPSSAYHVVVTSYADFVKDYTHFCQVSFQAVIMDDGMSWLGCAHYDPQGDLGKVWNSAIWSKTGSNPSQLTSRKNESGGDMEKKSKTGASKKDSESREESRLQIGLTARHRILVASTMHAKYRGQVYKAPVPGLLSFLTPQFTDVIRDDWERCKVYNCKKSMEHIRSLVARSVVVYSGGRSVGTLSGLLKLSFASMNGELPEQPSSAAHEDNELDEWVKRQKIVQSRKFAAAWFRPLSPMRKSFGELALDSIITTVKKTNALGFVCEEVVTASSLTMSGQNGGVVGLGAYRAAVRCGRSFNSEQGLRAHIVACHAPPDTWNCRSCGEDCGTSQARSHHERGCGVEEKVKEFGGAVPSVGKAPKSRGPKKKIAKNLAAAVIPDKDDDGSTRVLGYRGVWLKNGKYFIKIGGVALTKHVENKEVTLYLDTLEEAAKRYDDVITTRGRAREVEMNYKEDGSRIMYDDKVKEVPEKSTDTAAVVPALAVINIKDLPKHVKPLLRDPNQTSRTGGNSKRYVYAYRGVCRQQRKGHDRWQSQISFNGCNHYLGTFDSEYDAAAVYAWAHLILYGEEATKQAQREGEEAAAKFEQRKKDIALGKISPDQKPARKKKTVSTKKQKTSNEKSEDKTEKAKAETTNADVSENSSVHNKKIAPVSLKDWNKLKLECAQMLSSGTKGTSKATILGTKKDIADRNDSSLHDNIPGRIGFGSNAFLQSVHSCDKYSQSLPVCIPLNTHAPSPAPRRCALLIGLQANDFSWQVMDFIASCQNIAIRNHLSVSSAELYGEYGIPGMNIYFRTMILSSSCILGRASDESQEKYSSILALNRLNPNMESTMGMTVGDVDCDVNGPKRSCSPKAAEIIYMPSNESNFRLAACNDDDIVTINGQRIVARTGHFPMKNRDVCSVGARVFVFVDDNCLA